MAGLANNPNPAHGSLHQLCCQNAVIENADESGNESNADNEYPIDTRPLENQVAGHAFEDGKFTVGMLKHKDGYVLKPVNFQGEKEIRFYEELQRTEDPVLLRLKTFTPEYYGTTVLDMKGKEVKFLLLKDMTNGFVEPCIMDIKVGKQTWEPGAPLEKQKSEKEKYGECKQHMSFCIPGFQIYDVKTKKYYKYDKDYGKKLSALGVYEAFRIFFNKDSGTSKHVLIPVLNQLNEILEWFKHQKQIHIYSSSILLAYDASVLREKLNVPDRLPQNCGLSTQSSISELAQPWLCVSLIDFAHVIPTVDNVLDINYIDGLERVIRVLETILLE